jgi:energy-coupling factor transport system ATP-binding protein
MRRNGIGLSLLSPGARLILTIVTILYLQYEFRWKYIIVLTAVSVALLALNLTLRFKLLFFSSLSITFVFIFIGNIVFPPESCAGTAETIMGMSACAVDVALFFSIRRVGMLLFGFAWLNATSAAEMADLTRQLLRPFSRHYPYDRIGMFLFAIFDRLFFEYELANYSLIIRMHPRSDSRVQRFRRKIYVTYLKLSAVILRIFTNTPKIAFAIGMHAPQVERKFGILRVSDLSAGYDESKSQDVLTDVTFEANEGDVILLRGAPGSGKSTLLRAIARYIPRISGYARGTITVGDETWLPSEVDLTETLPALRMVTQDSYEFFLGLTVRQELALHSRRLEDLQRATALMGIENLLDRDVSSLSGGERIKVILACVLASRVRILLLDNPLSQLDSQARNAFLAGLKIYVREVRPIVIVCDRLDTLFAEVSTRELILERGRLIYRTRVFDDRKTENYGDLSHYKSSDIARFQTRENFTDFAIAGLRNTVVERDGRRVLNQFSLSVFPREIIALTGPNGIGKTTAMLALAGALPIRSGERFGGENIGISFQAPDLQFVTLRVDDELQIKGQLSDSSLKETKLFCVEELTWLGLSYNAQVLDLNPYVSRLLSISSMLQDTKILVIDEPTIEIPLERIPVLAKRLEQLRANGLSVIVITHVPEVMNLCDRIVGMGTLKLTSDDH